MPLCAIMRGMNHHNLAASEIDGYADLNEEVYTPLRVVGLATVLLGAVTLGLILGRELRLRYKFRRRTPSDFFSNAGDPITNAEYGMGV